jgi:multisubunit Na+/H+ antiporter MnhB subunit
VNLFTSLVRTVVPLIAGFLITQLVRLGVTVDQATVATVVEAIVTGAYYFVFRLAEQHLGTGFGWFLGAAKPPQYPSALASRR